MNQSYEREFEEAEAPRVSCVQIGDILKAEVLERDDEVRRIHKGTATYRIVEIHPFMVRAVSVKAPMHTRCFSYGDLIIMGKEVQAPGLEAMRKFTMEDEQKFGRKPSRA